MANVLEFALGLQTAEFLSNLDFAGGELLSFAGLAEVVRKAWENTWDVMEQGAALRGVANATGESVAELAAFQHGLEAVGAGSININQLFLYTQKALSGINDQGERTDIMFSQLGLSFSQLQGEDTVQAITDISGALSKLDPSQAAGVAEAIFGRGNASTMLQIANDAQDFKDAMQKAGLTAELWEKFADIFKTVVNDVDDVKNDILGIWILVGGKIAPEFHKIFSELDFYVRAFAEAIKEGKIGEVLQLELMTGIEYAGSFLTNFFGSDQLWSGIWGIMKGGWLVEFAAIENYFVQGIVLWETLLQELAESFGKNFGDKIAFILDMAAKGFAVLNPMAAGIMHAAAAEIRQNGGNNTDFSTLYTQNEAQVNNQMGNYSPGNITAQGAQDILRGSLTEIHALEDALKHMTAPDADKLSALLQALEANIMDLSDEEKKKRASLSVAPENHWHPEFTSLEKMGFVFSTGGHVQNPLLQRQLEVQEKILAGVQQYNDRLRHEVGGYNETILKEINHYNAPFNAL